MQGSGYGCLGVWGTAGFPFLLPGLQEDNGANGPESYIRTSASQAHVKGRGFETSNPHAVAP